MKFLLLIKGESEWAQLSPAEMQASIEKYNSFAAELRTKSQLVDADGLDPKRVQVGPGDLITDGPFAETKEMIGGYYVFQADSWEAAIEVSKRCPALEYGACIELRKIMDY
jgi:hypothetical protein